MFLKNSGCFRSLRVDIVCLSYPGPLSVDSTGRIPAMLEVLVVLLLAAALSPASAVRRWSNEQVQLDSPYLMLTASSHKIY